VIEAKRRKIYELEALLAERAAHELAAADQTAAVVEAKRVAAEVERDTP
jgi:hypothetical protein